MTGNPSQPWHPDRKHYRCSRRENLTLMVANMYKHMGKVVIKILQGSAVTLTTLGGLTIHPRLQISYSTYRKLADSRQSYCKNYQAYFFGPPCIGLVRPRKEGAPAPLYNGTMACPSLM